MFSTGKHYIIPCVTMLFVLSVISIAYPQKITTFQMDFGGTSDEIGCSVVPLPDKGFIVGSTTRSFGAGGADILLVRTDSLGKKIWAKTYGGSNDEGTSSFPFSASVDMIFTPDSNIAVLSSTASYGKGGNDVYFLKIDLNGNVRWTKTYGGTSNDFGLGIYNDPYGGFLITGETYSFGAGQGDILLIKTDTAGGVEWAKAYGGSYTEEAGYEIRSTRDGNFLICGYSNISGSSYNQMIMKVDKSGNLLFNKVYGTSNYDDVLSVVEGTDSSIYLSGFTYNVFNGANTVAMFSRCDKKGNLKWAKIYDVNAHTAIGKALYDNSKKTFDCFIVETDNGRIGMMNFDSSGKIVKMKNYGPLIPGSYYTDGHGEDLVQIPTGGFALSYSSNAFGNGSLDNFFVKVNNNASNSDSCNISQVTLSPFDYTSYINDYTYSFTTTSFTPSVASGIKTSVAAIHDSLICSPFVTNFSWTTICLGQGTPFFDSSYYNPVLWAWDFGDPGSSSNISKQQNPTHTYSAPGKYTVKLASGNGSIKDSITHIITVLPSYSNLKKTTTSFCLGDSIKLVAKGTEGVKFSWTPASLLSDSTDSSVWAHPNKDTTFVVKVTNSEGCTNADSFIVKSDSLSHTKTITNSFCMGDSVNLAVVGSRGVKFSWSPASLLSDFKDSSVWAHPNMNTTFVVKITNRTGCVTSDSFIVKLVRLSQAKTVTTSFCPGDSVNLTVSGSGGVKFSWSPSSLLSDSTDSSVWIHPKKDTTLAVTIANSAGCTISDTFIVKLDHLSPISLGGNISSCTIPVELSPGQYPGLTYLWSTGGNTDTIFINQTGKYWVKLNKRGCMASDTAIVTILAPAIFQNDNPHNTLFCSDDSDLTLDAGPGYKYLWSPGGDTSQKIQVTTTGIYTVQITAPDGCVASKTVAITNQCITNLFVPDAFTPNGDNLNDQFKPVSRYPLENYNMKIYNRWGERLFQSNNINIGWDGRFKNQLCPEDVYLFIILYKFPYETEQIKSGTVTLFR